MRRYIRLTRENVGASRTWSVLPYVAPVASEARQPFIHETAVVEEASQIGQRSQVWHHAHVRTGAIVGDDCVIGKNVFIDAGVRMGRGCKIQNNVSLYKGVELEDEVFVGPSAVFTNDRVPRASSDWEISSTVVRRGASIGANSTLVAGCEIGEWALVAAGAVVVKAVRPHQMVAGNPARPIGWLCRCGKTKADVDAPSLDCSGCDTHLEGLR